MEDLGSGILYLTLRLRSTSRRRLAACTGLGLVFALIGLAGQSQSPPLTLLSAEGRRTIPTAQIAGQEYVPLDELATALRLTVREESGAITVSYAGRTIILTPDQTLASVSGRLISLAAAPRRSGARLMVPLDFISRALAPVYDAKLDLRRASRLLVIGGLRVPRVTVRHEALPNAARLVIESSPPAPSTVSREDGRLVIRFEADAIEAAIPGIQPQGFVQAVRPVDAVTLAAELGPRFESYRASDEAVGNGTRLVIDLVGAPTDVAAIPAAPAAPAPAPGPDPPASGDLPVFGTPATTLRTVVIDPGHGGGDIGARSGEGLEEKELTLSVARRLRSIFETRLGLRVLLTREDDRDVTLERRTALANNNKADVFISLHVNASPRPVASGAAVHVAAFDDEARSRVPQAPVRVPVFGGGNRDIDVVPWDLAQIRHVGRSGELAAILEERLQGRVPLDPSPARRVAFHVLESANMPAVLIEMGFITNPEQAGQLASGSFQNTFAQAIFDAVVAFRDVIAAGGEQ